MLWHRQKGVVSCLLACFDANLTALQHQTFSPPHTHRLLPLCQTTASLNGCSAMHVCVVWAWQPYIATHIEGPPSQGARPMEETLWR
jgi:hypothetical protein